MRKVLPGSAARGMFLLSVLLFTLPAISHAWYINAKVHSSAGQGTLTPSGNVNVAGTTGTSQSFTVAPFQGYRIDRVTLDGLPLAPASEGNYAVPYNGKSWRYLIAYFAPLQAATYSITISAGAGGAIREANGASLNGIPPGSSRTILVVPNQGYRIASLSASGAEPVDNGDGTQSVFYTNLQSSQSVTATFGPAPFVSAHAGPDVYAQGNGPDFTATLDGRQSASNQGAITYAWSGPGNLVFGTPNAAVTSVWSATAGAFAATLTVTSGGIAKVDTAMVNVPSRAAFLEGYCISCHSTRDPDVIAAYDQSRHKTTGPGTTLAACQSCHDPTDSKHYTVKRPTSVCQPCHAIASPLTHAADEALASQCLGCHNPHSGAVTGVNIARHFDGSFGGNAQYVSHGASCSDCHADNSFSANAEILDDFAASGHADVTSPAWASNELHDWVNSDCRPCHTRVGFVDALTGTSTTIPPGEPGQILACNACHTSVVDGALRPSEAVQATFVNGLSGSSVFPASRSSNLCIRCHSGRSGGSTIKNSTADFGNTSFINSHYLAAGATLFRSAYEYAGRIYSSAPYQHWAVGGDNGGPCIHCHLATPDSHLFQPVAKDETGAITALTATSCDDCHQDLTPAGMNDRVAGFAAAAEALRAQLSARGIHFGAAHPYFYTAPYEPGGINTALKNWDGVYPGQGKNVMGAAYNLNLLLHEPGAWAHNQRYARRLIFDSMDFIADGALNEMVDIDALIGSGLTQAQADAAKAYLDGSPTLNGLQRP